MTTELVRIDLGSGSSIELDWSKVGPHMKIYTHLQRKDANGGPWKEVGDVVAEGQFSPLMLAQFMDNGNFPYPPGVECLKHRWTPRRGSIQGKVQFGCKPCKDRTAGSVAPVSPPPTQAVAGPAPLIGAACPWCPTMVTGSTNEETEEKLTAHRTATHWKPRGRKRKAA